MIFKKKYEISIGGKYFQRSAQRRKLLASKYVDLKDLVVSNSFFFPFCKHITTWSRKEFLEIQRKEILEALVQRYRKTENIYIYLLIGKLVLLSFVLIFSSVLL